MTAMTRQQLVELVQRIIDVDADSEAAHDALVERFEANVPRPGASSLIFWPHDEGFDRELTAEEIVDIALAHRAIRLGPGQ
jgi:hypothetical protein